MVSNKNNKINPFKSMMLSPVSSFRQSWYFSIKPLYSLIMLLGIAICVAAGTWQYQKSQFYLGPVAQSSQINGYYLNTHTHFLDNKTLKGQVGYAIITPFDYDGQVYLINRGFVAYKNREKLPVFNPVYKLSKITGLLVDYQTPLLLNSKLIDPIKKRIQYIDHQYFSDITGKRVSRKILKLQKGSGLQTLMPIKAPYLNHHRHQGYALQWFLLAIAGLIILVLSSITRSIKNGGRV
jgi:surfeit locus 1 family protein